MEPETSFIGKDERFDSDERRRKKKKEPSRPNFVTKWRERASKNEATPSVEQTPEQPAGTSRMAAFGKRVGRLLGWRPRTAETVAVPAPERSANENRIVLLASAVGELVVGRTRQVERQVAEEITRPDARVTPNATEQLTAAREDLGDALYALRTTAHEAGVPLPTPDRTEPIELMGSLGEVEIPLRAPVGRRAEQTTSMPPLPGVDTLVDPMAAATRPAVEAVKPAVPAALRTAVEAGLLAAAIRSELKQRSMARQLGKRGRDQQELKRTLVAQQERIATLEQVGVTTPNSPERVTPQVVAQTVEIAKEQTKTTAEVTAEVRASRQEATIPELSPAPKEVPFRPEAPAAAERRAPAPEASPLPVSVAPEQVRPVTPETQQVVQRVVEQKAEAGQPNTEVEESILQIERLEVRDRNPADDDKQSISKGNAAQNATPLSNATLLHSSDKTSALKDAQQKLTNYVAVRPSSLLYGVVLFATIIALIYIVISMH